MRAHFVTDELQSGRKSLVTGFTKAVYSLWCFFSFAHVGGLLDKGEAKTLDQYSAREFHPNGLDPRRLQQKFDAYYDSLKVERSASWEM